MPTTPIFHRYRQSSAMDCGPTCLRMVANYYGRSLSLDFLKEKARCGRDGTSLLGVAHAAKSIGLKSIGCKLTFERLITDVQLPAIVHWDQRHFVVLTPNSNSRKLIIADPAKGLSRGQVSNLFTKDLAKIAKFIAKFNLSNLKVRRCNS